MRPYLNSKYKDAVIIAILCLVFLLLGALAMDYDIYVYAFLPVVAMVGIFLFMKFYYTAFLIALVTPFSIFLRNEVFSISIPAEPLLILTMLIFLWDAIYNHNFERKYLNNIISVMIIVQLSWMLLTSLFSWNVEVSIKYLISRLWFVIPCYFMMLGIFKDKKTIRWFIFAYAFSLCIVCIICTIRYVLIGGYFADINRLPYPFYNDHTAYGAAIGLMLPICLYYTFASKQDTPNKWWRIMFGFISVWLIIGFVLSYARATWLSVIVAGGVFVLVWLKIKLRAIIPIAIVLSIILFAFWTPIMQKLELNSQDSSGTLSEHITSISNVSTDASNVERINRWSCAIRMAKERPITGWGAGTYQFVYGSYQKYSQRTIISTNEGTLGNAHSEYLGPLCEQGLIGCMIVIALFCSTIYIGIKTYKNAKDRSTSLLALFTTLSLITYYVHGTMNNFLDTDKLSVPVWAMMAVVSSLYTNESAKENNNTNKTFKQLDV